MTKGMPKPRPPDLPRSLVLLALAALLPIVLFAILSATSSLRQQRDALERDLETQAQRLSQQVDRQIDGTVDPRAFAETARRIHAEQPPWRILTLIDRQGIRIADSLGSPPQPVVEPQSLQRVFETGAATGAAHGIAGPAHRRHRA
jgi:hypothetical protein